MEESKTWLKYDFYYKNDLFDKIIEEGGVEKAAEGFVEKFMVIFENYKDIVILCNKSLENKK